ncbi:MAG: hypothetical protein V3U54_13110 [Thermodesulfobacteriota bacterium]
MISLEHFLLVFVWLTILHPIVDFGIPLRGWKGEYWLVTNPLHALWDSSRFRTHPKYYQHFSDDYGEHALIPEERKFWLHLAKDQTAHVVLNFIMALIVAYYWPIAFVLIGWFTIGVYLILQHTIKT